MFCQLLIQNKIFFCCLLVFPHPVTFDIQKSLFFVCLKIIFLSVFVLLSVQSTRKTKTKIKEKIKSNFFVLLNVFHFHFCFITKSICLPVPTCIRCLFVCLCLFFTNFLFTHTPFICFVLYLANYRRIEQYLPKLIPENKKQTCNLFFSIDPITS